MKTTWKKGVSNLKYILNAGTNKLHIEGCRHIGLLKSGNYLIFNSENEARMYGGNTIGFCKNCDKKREQILKESEM